MALKELLYSFGIMGLREEMRGARRTFLTWVEEERHVVTFSRGNTCHLQGGDRFFHMQILCEYASYVTRQKNLGSAYAELQSLYILNLFLKLKL